eukprot:SAG31_NODE_3267_length_4478_cov_2.996118_3_plen_48_part_00
MTLYIPATIFPPIWLAVGMCSVANTCGVVNGDIVVLSVSSRQPEIVL